MSGAVAAPGGLTSVLPRLFVNAVAAGAVAVVCRCCWSVIAPAAISALPSVCYYLLIQVFQSVSALPFLQKTFQLMPSLLFFVEGVSVDGSAVVCWR